ncbi:HD-GYP domain-containing protein [Lichenibacterium ramalinae]|uniref:HD domain-containing protein n=1 Tax=Lichenibacterium ramalinae TaxID=2316527 RepID=A0A4Q2R635_9HYPH|nr:HD domain-containing phosphohydrolase [Lichenibacterium ramalinae]RYB01822.1 HD domain-containing protein [Lichenibacterium ramalinae]
MLAMLVRYSRNRLFHLGHLQDIVGTMRGSPCEAATVAREMAGRGSFDLVTAGQDVPTVGGIAVGQRLRDLAACARLPTPRLAAASHGSVRPAAPGAVATGALPTRSKRIGLGVRLRNFMTSPSVLRACDDLAARLAGEVEVATRKLHEREEEMIFRLSLAVEYRDGDTGEHTVRVARYSRMIAEELGLPAEDCRNLYLAAPLHDIGKVAVPDQVLLKPGRLTAEETMVVRMHAAVGERILGDSASDLIRLAAEIAGYHHERWDGAGYPRGLAGEAIPLSARIVAVADVFDAMTTERPYKSALPVGAALAYLSAERSRHFEPRCVDAFLSAYARLHPGLARSERGAGVPDPAAALPPTVSAAWPGPCGDVALPRACAG